MKPQINIDLTDIYNAVNDANLSSLFSKFILSVQLNIQQLNAEVEQLQEKIKRLEKKG